jgi:hypothetical protein
MHDTDLEGTYPMFLRGFCIKYCTISYFEHIYILCYTIILIIIGGKLLSRSCRYMTFYFSSYYIISISSAADNRHKVIL